MSRTKKKEVQYDCFVIWTVLASGMYSPCILLSAQLQIQDAIAAVVKQYMW